MANPFLQMEFQVKMLIWFNFEKVGISLDFDQKRDITMAIAFTTEIRYKCDYFCGHCHRIWFVVSNRNDLFRRCNRCGFYFRPRTSVRFQFSFFKFSLIIVTISRGNKWSIEFIKHYTQLPGAFGAQRSFMANHFCHFVFNWLLLNHARFKLHIQRPD